MFKVFEMVDKSTGNVPRLCQNFSKRYRVAVVPYKNGTYAHISDELKHSTISMPLEIFTSIVKDSGELITRSQMLSNNNNTTGRKRGLEVVENENEPPAKRQKLDNLTIKLVRNENGWARIPTFTYQPTSSYQPTSTHQPTSTYQPTSKHQPTSVGWKKILEELPTSHHQTAFPNQTTAYQTAALPNRIEVPAPPKQLQQNSLQHLLLQQEQSLDHCADDNEWYHRYM